MLGAKREAEKIRAFQIADCRFKIFNLQSDAEIALEETGRGLWPRPVRFLGSYCGWGWAEGWFDGRSFRGAT
jgi:hypothetical protein